MPTQKSKLILAAALLVCLVLPCSANVASAVEETPALFAGFTLEVDIGEDGNVTVRNLDLGELHIALPANGEEVELDLAGVRVKNVSTRSLERALANFGLPVQIPRLALDPQQVATLSSHGIEHLAISKISHGSWQELSLYVNNTKTLEADAADETLVFALANTTLGDLERDLAETLLLMEDARIIANFPSAQGVFSFTDEIESEEAQALNLIEAGATISGTASAGEIISVGAVTVDEMNAVLEDMGMQRWWPHLVANPLSLVESEVITATAGRNGFRVESDNGHWANVAWDQEARHSIYTLLPAAMDLAELNGYALPVSERDLAFTADLVEAILPHTEVQLTIRNGMEQMEGSPRIDVGQQLTFEVDEAGRLLFEGMWVGETDLDHSVFDNLGPLALCWDGERKEVRYSIDGVPLPPVFIGEDAVTQIGPMAAESLPGLGNTPWSKVDALLANTHIGGVVLATAGGAPEELGLDYSVGTGSKPQTGFMPSLIVDREGGVGLGNANAALNLTPWLERNGTSLTGFARLIPPAIGSAQLAVDSSRVDVTLNEADVPVAGLRWDNELRKNAFDAIDRELSLRTLVNETTFGILEMLLPTWEETVTEIVAGGRGFQWGVSVTVVDSVEDLPPSAPQRLLDALGVSP